MSFIVYPTETNHERSKQLYPILCTLEGRKAADFFVEKLGFEVVFKSEWYWHISMADQASINLAFVQADHPSVPEAYRKPVQGMILNIEMENIDQFHGDTQHLDWPVTLPLGSEPYGFYYYRNQYPTHAVEYIPLTSYRYHKAG